MVTTEGCLWSQVLQLEWRAEGDRLRLYDPGTETYLLSPGEQAAARREAEARAEMEAAARREAEARLAALEAEMARLQDRLAGSDDAPAET